MSSYLKRSSRLIVWVIPLLLVAGGCSSRVGNPYTRTARAIKIEQQRARAENESRKAAQAHAHYSAAVIDELNERFDLALQGYLRAAEADPTNPEMLLDVSRRFIRLKQQEKALELLTRAAALPKASGDVFSQMAVIYGQLGRREESIQASIKAIEKAPDSLTGYQTLYVNYLQTRVPEKALDLLAKAAARREAEPEFLLGVAELYGSLGVQFPAHRDVARREALAVLEKASQADSNNVVFLSRVADAFSLLGEHNRAAQSYEQLLARYPGNGLLTERSRRRLAEIYLNADEPDKARKFLEQIEKSEPTNAQVQNLLGTLANDEKDHRRAVDHFRRALLLNPDTELTYYLLAQSQLELNEPAEALETLEKARAKFQSSYTLEYLTALAYGGQKQYADAIRHYTAAEVIAKATTTKLDHLFYFQVAATHERNGDHEQAEKLFEKVLELSPDFAEAQNYLGYMWAEQGRNLDRALKLIRKAVASDPENAAFLDSLAWVLFKLGKPEEALPHMLKAMEHIEEPDETLHEHLGDIYQAVGRQEEARQQWKRALEIKESESVRLKLGGNDSGEPREP